MALLYGRTGRLTALFGGFRRGQYDVFAAALTERVLAATETGLLQAQVIVTHHETFSTIIQPPYSSTKG
jgi:hypothetical protein